MLHDTHLHCRFTSCGRTAAIWSMTRSNLHCSADIHMLRRYLRARGHDLAKAKAMFLAHIQWEKDFGVAELDQFEFTERDAVISVYPQGYHKVDKQVRALLKAWLCLHLIKSQGCLLDRDSVLLSQCRPIYIQHLGQVNIKKIYDVTTEDRMLKFHVQEWERCIKYIFPACSKVAGRHIDQIFSILDVKGTCCMFHIPTHATSAPSSPCTNIIALDVDPS